MLNNMTQRIITAIIGGALFWAIFIYDPFFFSICLALVGFIAVVFEWKNIFPVNSIKFWVILPVYPLLPILLLIYINQVPEYRLLLVLIFVSAFCFDSGSYFAGKLFGKHKIAPKISPGKTWEGFLGGIVSAFIGLLGITLYLGSHMSLVMMLFCAAIMSVLLFFGDLFESWLKRNAGIKDSGNLLPGHGGFLDRADGILFLTYFVFVVKEFLLNTLQS